jgi:hypothetical protein
MGLIILLKRSLYCIYINILGYKVTYIIKGYFNRILTKQSHNKLYFVTFKKVTTGYKVTNSIIDKTLLKFYKFYIIQSIN